MRSQRRDLVFAQVVACQLDNRTPDYVHGFSVKVVSTTCIWASNRNRAALAMGLIVVVKRHERELYVHRAGDAV